MSRLFVSLYLDEDVSTLVAELLRRRGFAAVTARDAKQLRRTDAEQLAYAAERQMAILTHNRDDYETLAREYIAAGHSHAGSSSQCVVRPTRSPGACWRCSTR